MWGSIIGGLLGAAGSIIGGGESNRANLKIAKRQMAFQENLATHGIRWRVGDAVGAGLHPLYALGAQPGNYSPVHYQDSMGPAIADAGQSIGRAVASSATQQERVAQALSLKLLESQIGETDARRDLALSEAARNAQALGPPMPNASDYLPDASYMAFNPFRSESFAVQDDNRLRGIVNAKAPDMEFPSSARTDTIAGVPGFWREFQLDGGRRIALPNASSVGEALESASESLPLMVMIYNENKARFGVEWARWFSEKYFGVDIENIVNPYDSFKEWAQSRGHK